MGESAGQRVSARRRRRSSTSACGMSIRNGFMRQSSLDEGTERYSSRQGDFAAASADHVSDAEMGRKGLLIPFSDRAFWKKK
ncbi:hypothetical protein MILUP08_41985 [Micromonospora lupini str. Lupac 08]|uniref:Uncharacterized protein n=1 Tax=Micromonospora lupini str. Lupac 08 TaxID=1150864 RepID=I0KZR9_9ACTN|nr:hypothetical protein MILUP08_41985 [Micromonospora lupini str. Lupac 08]